MKIAFQIIILGLFIGCSPKISKNTKSDFQEVKLALESSEYNYSQLKAKFPNFQVKKKKFLNTRAHTKIEKASLKLKENQITSLIANEDNSCGIIKVLKIEANAKMRVSYIYLNDKTKEGEKLADKILEEHRNGKPFAELAKKYSKDPSTSQKGGDLNWFNEKVMVKGFTQAIRNHEKGDVFKAITERYGWFVISNTHKTEERTEYEVIEIKKTNCK